MFDQLSDRLQSTLSDVRSRGKLSEGDVDAAMREIRLALLEADVNFKVVKSFTRTLKERCLGAEVMESLDPGQQVVKIVNELERIGDEIKKIAYKAQQMQRPERLSNVRFHEITRAAELAESNLQLALDAFARLDVNAAAQVVSNDEAIDSAFLSILRQLISYMMEDPRTITPALEIVFIAKSIERIGDHAKNVAENVVHVVKGKDVRHATAEQIRAEVAE